MICICGPEWRNPECDSHGNAQLHCIHPSDCLCLTCVPACAPPSKAEFDALPARWRRYVADLETLADPAGMVRENAMLRDQIRQLGVLIETNAPRCTWILATTGRCINPATNGDVCAACEDARDKRRD